MNQTVLIVVRHGNTFNSGDTILRVGGRTDLPLTEKGIAQGSAVGNELKIKGFLPEIVVTAPLLRTRRTAEEIAAHFDGLPLKEEPFLTELDYGMDDGVPENDVILRLGIVAARGEIRETTSLEELRERGKEVLKRWDNEMILPEAWSHLQEKIALLQQQWRSFGEAVLSRHAGKCVVAVTSNGIARFSRALLSEGSAAPENWKLATGAYGVFTFDDDRWNCRVWNQRPVL